MIFGQKASPLVVLFLSIDRLLAVVLFQQYKHFGLLYAVALVAIAYFISAIITVLAWIAAVCWMPTGLMVAQTCKTESVTPNWFFCLETGMRFFPGFICCFVYIYALSIVKSRSATITKGMPENDRRKQSQLTKNVAIIMIIEFLFTTLPFGYSFISFAGHYTQSEFFNTISPFSWSLSLFGAAGNFFLYALKYPKFRRALEKQILRKNDEQLRNIPNKTVFVVHTSKTRT
uniref:G-protein coupled receptors family 1 profile domain-containing protein n=1 Tax=Romanomermis culicivorax TaxID=13658 RepID=A0A915KFW8_ROMCU